jgi:hypothetical protein
MSNKEPSKLMTDSYYGMEIIRMLKLFCHHGMMRPQFPDRGDSLQIWRVVANILSKQSQTANRGWPSSLGAGQGANYPHHKKMCMLQIIYKHLANGWIFWHNLSTKKWI